MRNNIKTYETIEKDEIFCFQSLCAQLLDIKQLRKIGGHESLLPSQSENAVFQGKWQNFSSTELLIVKQM